MLIATETEDEAYYLAAVLNSQPFNLVGDRLYRRQFGVDPPNQ